MNMVCHRRSRAREAACYGAFWAIALGAAPGLLGGCSSAGHGISAQVVADPARPGAHRAEVGKQRVLTYYIDQSGQDPHNVGAQTEYHAKLAGCRQAGLPTTPLSASEVAKLGVRRVRVWQRPGRQVTQIDTWVPYSAATRSLSAAIADACRFAGIKMNSVREIAIPPDQLYVLNLTDATGIREVIDQFTLARAPISPDVGSDVLEKLKSMGFEKLGTSQVSGQPCQLWRGSNAQGMAGDKIVQGGTYTECDWSGGAKWGESDIPRDVGHFALSRKMDRDIPQKPGWITTSEFDVGHLPVGSDRIFELPGNISIRSGTAAVTESGRTP